MTSISYKLSSILNLWYGASKVIYENLSIFDSYDHLAIFIKSKESGMLKFN